ncbi:MAG: DRTGG domain-containing protein [Candidatus Bipolaricaulota bacterium]
MKSLIVASTREGAGKTSVLVGLAGAMGRCGYVKPLGDRFLYRKKRLWDYDAALFARLWGLGQEPETMSIGFDHSKLRFMYDRPGMFGELRRLLQAVGADRDVVLIECGKDLAFGSSVYLDPLTISQETGAPVVLVTGGGDDEMADDVAFVKRFVGADEATIAGVIVNKALHPEDVRDIHLPEIERLGIAVYGVIPHDPDLATRTVALIAERLFARVIAGEAGLTNTVRTVAVGAMSAAAALGETMIHAADKLIITSGDRSDMILTALDAGGTSAVVLTNNILPPAHVISRAEEQHVPLLLVPGDTYAVAMQVEHIEPLLSADDPRRLERVSSLVSENVDVGAIVSLAK